MSVVTVTDFRRFIPSTYSNGENPSSSIPRRRGPREAVAAVVHGWITLRMVHYRVHYRII